MINLHLRIYQNMARPMEEPRYHINLFWSQRDESWVADVPDLKSCSAFGDTSAEALAEVEVAMSLWLETARENGYAMPKPLYRPDHITAA